MHLEILLPWRRCYSFTCRSVCLFHFFIISFFCKIFSHLLYCGLWLGLFCCLIVKLPVSQSLVYILTMHIQYLGTGYYRYKLALARRLQSETDFMLMSVILDNLNNEREEQVFKNLGRWWFRHGINPLDSLIFFILK